MDSGSNGSKSTLNQDGAELVIYQHSYPQQKKSRVQQGRITKATKSTKGSKSPREPRNPNEPNEPNEQRQPNMFIIYRSSRLKEFKRENKQIAMTELSKIISKEWGELSESDKIKFQREYQMNRYNKDKKLKNTESMKNSPTDSNLPHNEDYNPSADIDPNESGLHNTCNFNYSGTGNDYSPYYLGDEALREDNDYFGNFTEGLNLHTMDECHLSTDTDSNEGGLYNDLIDCNSRNHFPFKFQKVQELQNTTMNDYNLSACIYSNEGVSYCPSLAESLNSLDLSDYFQIMGNKDELYKLYNGPSYSPYYSTENLDNSLNYYHVLPTEVNQQ